MYRNLLVVSVLLSLVPTAQLFCSTPAIRNGAAKLKKRGRRIRFKCYRGFTLVGPIDASCTQNGWSPSETPVCVSTGCLQHPQFDNGEVSIVSNVSGVLVPSGSILQFTCYPGHLLQGDPVSWCDGLLWNSSIPTCTLPYTPPRLSCSFNDVDTTPTCGWSSSLDLDTVWTLTNSSTPTVGTGPNTGFVGASYIYLEASGEKIGSKARFISPVYPANISTDACIFFAFYMQGVDMGSLRVGQGPDGLQDNLQTLDEFIGDFGAVWNLAVVQIQPSRNPFQLFFEGTVGNSYLSDIAIDAIHILNGSDCTEVRTSHTRPQPTTLKSLSPASCWGRCDRNGSDYIASNGWVEGVCDCTPICLLGVRACCTDYVTECGISKISPRVEVASWVTWSTITGIACLVIVGLIVLLTAARWQHVRPERMDENEDDMARMVEDDSDDQAETGAQGGSGKQRRFSDLEEIDFTLATEQETDQPLKNRQITQI
ncbi:MAM and LDL-receptor class A domain-containing protein 1 [Eurytemora carolleeae]|uniref:MAM and LDL-receptor class A domain-containing protein 1 n=1 Tax=Eurytemora carolleeae TaxID=1294199 RepID=UPI000C766F7B|nr:MAM and LDL-receptor class A domain-containing protein 1 [Eurytemora carolleeae]|eukprot:XP_023336616.1 MAM and LDL-receptor class A domain-containing protein 1-like [Eurytemora affinis]